MAAQGPLARLRLQTTSRILALYALFKGHVLLYNPNGTTLTFDAENRLSGYGSQMSASYTGEGLRAEKQVGSSVTYFLYDGGLPVCELDGTGNVSATNTFGALGLLSRHTASGSVFYSFDPIGNVCQRLDANGTVLGSYLFDSYGNRTSTDDSNDPYSGLGGQAGYYTDWESGLSLLGYRYYDPTAGRFLNRDPIGYAGGMNLYGYVANSPTNGLDPSGLTPCFANDDGSPAYDNCYLSDWNSGDRPGLAGAQGFSSYMLGSLIPGYGFIPAIRGKDCWGCPLSPMQRVMSAVSGGLSAMPLADVADEGMAADASMASSTPSSLYHYTSDSGLAGILKDNALNPSLVGGRDAVYGSGQYLTDIAPGTMCSAG